ncbi:MAG: hypothetical protein ABI120_12350 [Gemmatimonadaceae bacterium]
MSLTLDFTNMMAGAINDGITDAEWAEGQATLLMAPHAARPLRTPAHCTASMLSTNLQPNWAKGCWDAGLYGGESRVRSLAGPKSKVSGVSH